MRARLYAKKINGKGHVFLQSVVVPDGTTIYEVPVKQPLQVVTQTNVTFEPNVAPVRVFRRVYSPLEEVMGWLPRFLEE